MYESPISLVIDQMATELATAFDKEVLTAFRRYHIDIDKDELIKALAYDRGQYEKGYADGLVAERWVRVEDELPEPFVTVLVYEEETGRTYIAIWEDHGGLHKYWVVPNVQYKVEPTHWMPIPDRPEEVRDGN